MAAAAAALVVTVAGPATAREPDSPGNDGTIKVDDVPFDDHLNNEVHVGCAFQVDFHGYAHTDDLTAEVTFEAVAPTAGGEILSEEVDLEADVTAELDADVVGEVPLDEHLGGGVALNASARFDLWAEGLAGIDPHPDQGFHVKLTVRVDGGSIGADVKHKVFWVTDCGTPGSTTSTTAPSTTTSTTAPEGPGDDTPSTPGPDEAGSSPRDPSDHPNSSQPDEPVTEPHSNDGGDGGGGLPLTGSNTLPLFASGLGLLSVGGATLYGARRLRSG